MAKQCEVCGKGAQMGNQVSIRGKQKYLGGVGIKTTGVTKRKVKPNIQKVRAVIDGKVCRVHVSTRAIRMGLITKPVKRDWSPQQQSQAQTAQADS